MAGGLFGGGDGSSTKPFLIEDASDLYQVRNHLSSYFRLNSNINCGEPPYNTGRGWKPIEGFTGYLDGNGKRIFNLTINTPDDVNVGLFRSLTFASGDVTCHVNDLSFESVHIVGNTSVGALAGTVTFTNTSLTEAQAKLKALNVDGYVEGVDNLGGLVGTVVSTTTAAGQFVLAVNCTASVEVCANLATAHNIGQFVGVFNDATSPASVQVPAFIRCVATGIMSANSKVPCTVTDGYLAYTSTRANGVVYANCFQDASRWPIWTAAMTSCTSRPSALATSDLKLAVNQVNLKTALNSAGRLMFDIADGQYPSLYFTGPDYVFIYADGAYLTYDFPSAKWVQVSTTQPTRQQAITSGLRRLTDVPSAAWTTLKTYTNVSIVNVVDKKDSTTRGEFRTPMTVDQPNSSTDKTVFRTKVAFTTKDGAFAGVNF